MGFLNDFFGRGGRVVRGQANQAMSAVESANFEAVVRQAVLDMKTELNNTVRASASAMANYNRLESEYQKYARQSEDWKARANEALDAGNEDLARRALAKKSDCDTQVQSMQPSIDQARVTSEKLKNQVAELKHKIDDGERTATTLVARKNAADAQRKVAEAMAGVGRSDNAFQALRNFEETVAKDEATATAYDQLSSAGKDDDLEKEFKQLKGGGVDKELEEMKRARQLPRPTTPPALGPGSSS